MRKYLAGLTAALLAAALLMPLPARADSGRADKLASLHLLRGTGVNPDGTPDYSLNEAPSRLQGLIMLIRLLGRENEALSFSGTSPFTDVSGQGARYVAYAWRNGITNGADDNSFQPGGALSGKAYVALLLRALGYRETDGDFRWGGQMTLAASLGILTPAAGARLENASITRGDMVDLSYAALTCPLKDGSGTLAEKLVKEGVFTRQEGRAAGVLGGGNPFVYQELASAAPDEARYTLQDVTTSTGTVSAHVVTVNPAHPSVTVKAVLTDGTPGKTASFQEIVKKSGGALAVINANPFATGYKLPQGYVMTEGELLYGESGLSSLGITREGTLRVGRPALSVRLRSGGEEWTITSVNTAGQSAASAVLYTPAYGERVTMRVKGWALTASSGTIAEFYSVTPGAVLTIPVDGYVVYMGSAYATTEAFRIPQIGSSVSYVLRAADEEGFVLDGVESIVSGAPRLLRDGTTVTALEPGFTGVLYTSQAADRTAVGMDRAGNLLLVCVPAATIGQLREVMAALGCVDAFALDGGASCGMYYDGTYLVTPSRELAVTLQVFVDGY